MTALIVLVATLSAHGGDILVPRVDRPALVEDFLAMAPYPPPSDRLARTSGSSRTCPERRSRHGGNGRE